MLQVPDAERVTMDFLYFTANMVVWPDEIRYATTDAPAPFTGALDLSKTWTN